MVLAIFVLTALVSPMFTSDCEVSEWSTWSRCYGTCFYALAVRNRDVIRPGLPDKPQGPVRRCPVLYETRFCTVPSCQEGSSSDAVDLPSRSGHKKQTVRLIVEKKYLRKGQLEPATNVAAVDPSRSVAHPDNDVFPVKSREKHSKNFYGQLTQTIEALQRHLHQEDGPTHSYRGGIATEKDRRPLKLRLDEEKVKPKKYVSSLAIDLPKHLKPARERVPMHAKDLWKPTEDTVVDPQTATDSTDEDATQERESAVDYKIPLNDMRIRRVLHRNKKLMKALIEAYKLQFTTSTVYSTFTTPTTTTTTSRITEAPVNRKLPEFTAMDVDGDIKVHETAISKEAPPSAEGSAVSSTEGFNTDIGSTTVETEETSSEDMTTEYLRTTARTSMHQEIARTSDALESTTSERPSATVTEELADPIQNSTTPQISGLSTEPVMDGKQTLEAETSTGTTTNTETPQDFSETTEVSQDISEISSTAEGSSQPMQDFTSSPTMDEFTSTSETTSLKRNVNSTVSTTTTTTQLPYWPKKGYVPNTRKHASEITSKLYMTREIIQALSEDPIRRSPILRLDCMENRRCCKVTRNECSDGSPPKLVKRYYRPRGSDICIPYHYPRCSPTEEMEEQPIQYEQNCQDLCFAGPEKRISPLLELAIEQ